MPNFDYTNKRFLVISHVTFKDGRPVEGPYASVIKAIKLNGGLVEYIILPIFNLEYPILYSQGGLEKSIKLPNLLGRIAHIKYAIDFVLITFLSILFLAKNKEKQKIIVGVDPLCAFPVVVMRKILKIKVIFYSVDFSEIRFSNRLLKNAYEFFDKICSVFSNQMWVTSVPLIEYKKGRYGREGIYIPNSFPFDPSYYEQNKILRTGNKVVWTGSILTDNQIPTIFNLCSKIQAARPEMEFWFLPINRINEFQKAITDFKLNNAKVMDIKGLNPTREQVVKCDLGLAVYDAGLGLTKYINPIKIWEYMMFGMPFMISGEPYLTEDIINSGIVYRLGPNNKMPEDASLNEFISPNNLKNMSLEALALAKKYDTNEIIDGALQKLIEN